MTNSIINDYFTSLNGGQSSTNLINKFNSPNKHIMLISDRHYHAYDTPTDNKETILTNGSINIKFYSPKDLTEKIIKLFCCEMSENLPNSKIKVWKYHLRYNYQIYINPDIIGQDSFLYKDIYSLTIYND